MNNNSNHMLYKCSKCHTRGHNTRTCGQKQPVRVLKQLEKFHTPPNLADGINVTHATSQVNNAWGKLPKGDEGSSVRTVHGTENVEGKIIEGVVHFNTVAALKREISKKGRMLMCLNSEYHPSWIGTTWYPKKIMNSELKCQVEKPLKPEDLADGSIVAYFPFPKASQITYNPDGSFTKASDGKKSTWVLFNTDKDAQVYIQKNATRLKTLQSELNEERRKERDKQKEEASRIAEERKRKWEIEVAEKKRAYAENPKNCHTSGCVNTVPYMRKSHEIPLCDSCTQAMLARSKDAERRKKADTVRMVNEIKKVNPKEKFTIITKKAWARGDSSELVVHKNVRVAVTNSRGAETPMLLFPKARTKGYAILPASVIVNNRGEVIYSGHNMVEECKQVIMKNSDYTEAEAETYATLLSQT